MRTEIDQDSDPKGQGAELEGGLMRMLFILSFSLGITIGAFRVEDAFLHPVFIVMIAIGSSVYAIRSYLHARRQVPARSPERDRGDFTSEKTLLHSGVEEAPTATSLDAPEDETRTERAMNEAHALVSEEASHNSAHVASEVSPPDERKDEEPVAGLHADADHAEIASFETKTPPGSEVENLSQVEETSDPRDTIEPADADDVVNEEPNITTTETWAVELQEEEGQIPERGEATTPAVTRDGGAEAGIETDEFQRIEFAAPPPTFAVKRSVLEHNPFAEDSPVERSSRQFVVPAPDREAFELTPVIEPKVPVEEGPISQPSTAETRPSLVAAAEEIPAGDSSVPVSQPNAAATGKSKPKQLSLDL